MARRGSAACSPETERRAGERMQSPACELPLVRLPSPSEPDTSSSAFVASGAPPSPFLPASGSSSACFLPELWYRGTLSWSSAPLQSSFVSSPPAPRSPPPPPERRGRSRERDPPLLSFLLLEHIYQGCPCRHGLASRLVRGRRGLPSPRRCRPQGWFPLDGSGCERGGADPEGSVLFHVRPWASRPCFMPLAFPGAFPFRAFPSRGAVPALAGLSCSLAGSRSTTADAARVSLSHRFRRRADPLPRFTRGFTGRMGQDDGFPRC